MTNINQKVAKIPFAALYAVIALFHTVSALAVNKFMSPGGFQKDQPWDHFLASTCSRLFGISYNNYFLASIPLYLLGFYGVIRIVGWLIEKLDKKGGINGRNHMAVTIILFLLPNFLYALCLLLGTTPIKGWGARPAALLGLGLIVVFSIASERGGDLVDK